MLVPEATTHEAVLQRRQTGQAREPGSVELFDIFRGKNVPEGQKSIAYAFTYRNAERTLTDAEVNAAHEKLVATFKDRLKAVVARVSSNQLFQLGSSRQLFHQFLHLLRLALVRQQRGIVGLTRMESRKPTTAIGVPVLACARQK